jgi:SAM-dependent methyltransferase
VGGIDPGRASGGFRHHDDDVGENRLSTTDASLVCGVIGAALLREWYVPSPERSVRLREMRTALDLYDESLPDDFAVELALDDAYAEWSSTYDERNPLLELERSVVHPILDRLVVSGAVVLDAGCGTGRHASYARRLGARVVGVDLSAAMLEAARARRPAPALVRGSMDALPISSASVDIIVCGLALCHAGDLVSVLREFRRVIRPNGRVVISDPHVRSRYVGGQGFYGIDDQGRRKFVRNKHRGASEWVSAATCCGFTIAECQEPPVPDNAAARRPVSELFPDAATAAFAGAPALWIWEFEA